MHMIRFLPEMLEMLAVQGKKIYIYNKEESKNRDEWHTLKYSHKTIPQQLRRVTMESLSWANWL